MITKRFHLISFRALYSVLVRSLPAIPGEVEDAVYNGLRKELLATQNEFSPWPIFNYEDLLTFRSYRLPNFQNHPDYLPLLRDIIPNFLTSLHKKGVLFPDYNSRKNISYISARSYCTFRPEREFHSVTTLDLERLYADTGIQVDGPCEVRSAFRYNDLKPRIYYAQGGTAYFKSRYMRAIATTFLEAVPATIEKRRRHPEEYLSLVFDHWDYTTAWDLTSFTSNLSELKWFMDSLITIISNHPLGNKRLEVFDSRLGVVSRSLVDILTDYNQTCNINPEFDLSRLEQVHQPSGEDDPIKTCRNSGLLGVPGNIGFSMALHGYVTGLIVGPNAVCVGDDAIALTQEDPSINLIPQIQALGIIQKEKFQILEPRANEGRTCSSKFLKRKLTATLDGYTLGSLFSFTALPPVLGLMEPSRRSNISSDSDRVKKVVFDLGRILWELMSIEDVTDMDLKLISNFYSFFYRRFQLPFHGALPGTHRSPLYRDGLQAIPYCIPPVFFDHFDPRILDWAEFVYDTSRDGVFRMPSYYHGRIKADRYDLYPGNSFVVAGGRIWTALEDLGYVEVEEMASMVSTTIENRRRFLLHLKHLEPGYFRLKLITVCKSVDLDLASLVSSTVHPSVFVKHLLF